MPLPDKFLNVLICPLTGSKLRYEPLEMEDGLLWAIGSPVFPVIAGIPRLLPEAMLDYAEFLMEHVPDYQARLDGLAGEILDKMYYCQRKNKRTKESFSLEWSKFAYGQDKTWDADNDTMLERFLRETDETRESLNGKLVFDVGCGNGVLDQLIAAQGANVLAMDMSRCVEDARKIVISENVCFIQGDLQFPPVAENVFDLVQCSGVLIHTNNTKSSFFSVEKTVKIGGKLSVWVYHPRKDLIHNLFNRIRKITSRLPLKIQYYVYAFTLLPLSFLIKRLKGNKQNIREMMIDILDWFTPEYRWEHTHDEVAEWFSDAGYTNLQKTTVEVFGFNTTAEKKAESNSQL